MTPFQIGIAGCLALVLLLLSSMPVALAMGLVGIVGFASVVSVHSALAVLQADLFDTFANYSLSVIPLFVFMGQVCFHSGISGKLFNAAYHWMGRLRGGMAMATVGACTIFGAICGSGPATAATMSAVALPEMRRFRYDPALAGGSLGMLIPPSVVFIVYGVLTEQSIGKLFIAGILPGILCAALFCVVIYIQCRINPALGPVAPKTTIREKLRSLGGVTDTLALFLFVMGGMMAGWFTPTEGAAAGALGSILIALLSGQFSWRMMRRAATETMRTSCMVLAIVAGAAMFGHFLAVTQIPSHLASWLVDLPIPSAATMLMIMLFFLVAGCFVDALALIFLTIPILYPVIQQLGYNPIWFGVAIVLVTQMGVITPPVGVNVYVVAGVDRSIPLQTVFRGSLPFLGTLLAAFLLLLIFPGIATWLPDQTDGGGGQKVAAVFAVAPFIPVAAVHTYRRFRKFLPRSVSHGA